MKPIEMKEQIKIKRRKTTKNETNNLIEEYDAQALKK